MKSTISVIIPTHNRAEFLMDVLESVYCQTRKPFEIIVVDDGSTDNTREAVSKSFKDVDYIHQKNSGPAAARNAGIARARGDVIVFLDDDDLLLPKAFELTVGRLESKIGFEIDIVSGLIMRVENIKKIHGKYTYKAIPPAWPERLIGSALIRKHLFDKVGLFDETLFLGEDIDWFMRAREKQVRFSFLPEITYLYRMHQNNLTKNKHESQRFILKVLKKSLTRRAKARAGEVSPLADVSDFHY